MGKVISILTRPIRNINVENRAHKVLEKQTRESTAAPRHPSTKQSMEKFSLEHPEYLSVQKEKYSSLVDNMKKLQLNSIGVPPVIQSQRKTLPEVRAKLEDEEYGFMEPEIVPEGKTTMRLALQFISQHNNAPNKYTAAMISEEHKLNVTVVQQVLKHFQTLQMKMPQEMLDKHPHLLKSLDNTKATEQTKLPIEPRI